MEQGVVKFSGILNLLGKNARNVVGDSVSNSNGQGEFSLESSEIWKDYLDVIEGGITAFQQEEGMSDIEFKRAVEDVGTRQKMLVKMMVASWEFGSFVEMCKDYIDGLEDECAEDGEGDYADEGKDGGESKRSDCKDEK